MHIFLYFYCLKDIFFLKFISNILLLYISSRVILFYVTFINRKIDCYIVGFSKPLYVYTVHCRLSSSKFEAPVVCLMYSILRLDWRTYVHQIPCHFQWLLMSTAFNIFLFQLQLGVSCNSCQEVLVLRLLISSHCELLNP